MSDVNRGPMRIASFNVQNMRLRASGLDGARDGDEACGPAALDRADRRLTAQVIAAARADVVALQEVFDRATLDHFHDRVLRRTGARPYPWRLCRPGNDGRGLDVALLSRRPVRDWQSHAALRPADLGLSPPPGVSPDLPVFRRDCLEVQLAALTLYVCHFKAPWPDPQAAHPVRALEAEAVRRLIGARFADPARARWLVVGDFNEPAPGTADSALAPLAAISVDLMARLPAAARWSFHDPQTGYAQLDGMRASPALARRWPHARPELVRAGLGREVSAFAGPRLAGVGRHRPHASDHAALVIDFPGL